MTQSIADDRLAKTSLNFGGNLLVIFPPVRRATHTRKLDCVRLRKLSDVLLRAVAAVAAVAVLISSTPLEPGRSITDRSAWWEFRRQMASLFLKVRWFVRFD